MQPGSSQSHGFFLRAPIDGEAERAKFQRRLSMTMSLIFILAGGFLVTQTIMRAVIAPDKLVEMYLNPGMALQLSATSVGLIGWLLLRWTKRSALVLDAIDVGGSFILCLGWTMMIFPDDRPGQSELTALLASYTTLVARAALLPSTAARTATVGGVCLLPLLPLTAILHRRPNLDSHPIGVPWVYAGIWALVIIATTTTISQVIYGLQREVNRAMQLGQYRLEERIGEGGMGTVYRASHTMLRRPTAIKVLKEEAGAGNGAERFEREVQITAELTHPNTIAVYDYGRTPDGLFYYAMEYLEGTTLEDLVHDFGPQSPERVVHILLQICGALEEAHAAGLVHRDIKPANVMLTERGRVKDVVKVLDFGLVKAAGDGSLSTSTAGTMLGTPHYMAPEAILAPQTVDGRIDLYAVGATAHFLLTGKYVFEGTNYLAILSQHLYEAPQGPSSSGVEVPAALESAILACLAKKPEERPASAAALAELLRAAGLAAWTPADARAWWEAAPAKRVGDRRASRLELSDTLAIALEDRVSTLALSDTQRRAGRAHT